jgi:hypothetical protein
VAPHNYPLKIASDESGRTSLTEPERLQVGQSAYAKLPEHQRRVATPTLLGSFGSIGRGALRLRKLNGKRSIGVRRCLNTDQRRVSPGWIALDNRISSTRADHHSGLPRRHSGGTANANLVRAPQNYSVLVTQLSDMASLRRSISGGRFQYLAKPTRPSVGESATHDTKDRQSLHHLGRWI